MNKQAVLLAAAARTTEVAGLKWDLKQAEEELGLQRGSSKRTKVSGTPFTYHIEERKKGKLVMLTKSIMIL